MIDFGARFSLFYKSNNYEWRETLFSAQRAREELFCEKFGLWNVAVRRGGGWLLALPLFAERE